MREKCPICDKIAHNKVYVQVFFLKYAGNPGATPFRRLPCRIAATFDMARESKQKWANEIVSTHVACHAMLVVFL